MHNLTTPAGGYQLLVVCSGRGESSKHCAQSSGALRSSLQALWAKLRAFRSRLLVLLASRRAADSKAFELALGALSLGLEACKPCAQGSGPCD